jgi:AbrB family looped-hinge helix DNA binding protein
MRTISVSTKGQIAIPAEIRRRMGITGGSRIGIKETPDGLLLTPARPSVAVDDLVGMLPNTIGHVAIEDLNGGRALATAIKAGKK